MTLVLQKLPYIKVLHQNIEFSKDPQNQSVNKKLGNGAFGTVYEGKWGDKSIALKEINIETAQQNLYGQGNGNTSDKAIKELIISEIQRLYGLNHQNVMEFYGVYEEDNKFYLVAPCYKGDLLSKLKGKPTSLEQRIRWAIDITHGLSYLHQQGMIHRDLKADNIFIDDLGRARLGDLGVAQVDRLIDPNCPDLVLKGIQGRRLRAPENVVYWGQSTQKTDIYALGFVFWQIINNGNEPEYAWSWMREILLSKVFLEKFELYDKEKILKAIKNADADEKNRMDKELNDAKREKIKGSAVDPLGLISFDLKNKILEKLMDADVPVRELASIMTMEAPEKFKQLILGCLSNNPGKRSESKDIEESLWGILSEETQDKDKSPLLKAYQNLDDIIQTKRPVISSYTPPYVTNEPLEEDPDTFWRQRKEEAVTEAPLSNVVDTCGQFLQDPSASTLVLLGDSGLGKTLSLYTLADNLLLKASPFIPVLIRPALAEWTYEALKGALKKAVETFPSYDGKNFLFLLDGYDECSGVQVNLMDQLGLEDFPGSKLIVTCRPKYLERERLDNYFGTNFWVRYFLPFNTHQLNDYLVKTLGSDTEALSQCQESLKKESGPLRTVLRNPFVLSLFAKNWETSSKKYSKQITRRSIYQSFIENWVEKK